MKNLKRIFLGVVLPPFLIGGAGTMWYQSQGSNHAATYLTAKVERGDIEDTISALGTLQPLRYVDVGTQVTGQLKTLKVSIGNKIKKGDLIAEIDPTIFASKAEMTEASLKNVQAQLSEKRVQQLLAQQLYERNRGLFASQAVSEELVEQSKAAVDQAAAQIEALNAQVELFQAQLMGDLANLRYTKIFAPMSGTVVSLNAREGQTLVASQQAPIILRIADLSSMTVWAQVSEADVPKIALDEPVYFTPIGLPERRWHGNVRQILPTPESLNNVILYDVLFDVPNKEQALKPQMSAQTSFVTAQAENALLVPVSALQTAAKHHKAKGEGGAKVAVFKDKKDNNDNKDKMVSDAAGEQAQSVKQKYTVRVLTASGQVEERPVVVGVKSRTQAQIISGLSEGEDVIVGTPDAAGNKKSKSKLASGATKL